MNQQTSIETHRTKLVGSHVPVELYWKFKDAYTARRENAKTAVENALLLYIDATNEPNETKEATNETN